MNENTKMQFRCSLGALFTENWRVGCKMFCWEWNWGKVTEIPILPFPIFQNSFLSSWVSHLPPWDTKAILSSPGLSSFRARQPRHIALEETSSTSSHNTTHPLKHLPQASHNPSLVSQVSQSLSGSSEVSPPASTCLETKIWRTASQRRSGTGPLPLLSCLSKSRLLAARAAAGRPPANLKTHRQHQTFWPHPNT